MKNTLGLLFLIICSTTPFAQGKIEPSSNMSKMLCKTWRANYMETDGKRQETKPEEMGGMTFTFKPDNTFLVQVYFPDKTQNGIWKYDTKRKMIIATLTHIKNDPSDLNIISLNETEMKSVMTFHHNGNEESIYVIYGIVKK